MSSIKGIRSTTAYKPVDESRTETKQNNLAPPTQLHRGDFFENENGAQNQPLTSVRVAGLPTGSSSNARTLSEQKKVDVLTQNGSKDISIEDLKFAFGIVQKYADQGRILPFGKNDNKLTREEFKKGYEEFRKYALDPNMATGLDEIMSIDNSWRRALGASAGLEQIQEYYVRMSYVADFIYRTDDVVASMDGDSKLLSLADMELIQERGLLSK